MLYLGPVRHYSSSAHFFGKAKKTHPKVENDGEWQKGTDPNMDGDHFGMDPHGLEAKAIQNREDPSSGTDPLWPGLAKTQTFLKMLDPGVPGFGTERNGFSFNTAASASNA